MRRLLYILLFVPIIGVSQDIEGCTDSLALNFNPLANTDDDSCCGSIPVSFGTQIGQTINGNGDAESLGISTSINNSGNIIAVGVRNETLSTNNGEVKVFENIGGSWVQLGQNIVGEAPGDDSSENGIELSSNGYILAITAISNDGNGNNSGHVRIYNYDGSSWTQLGQDIDGESVGDASGSSTSLSSDGNTIAVGAYSNYANNSTSTGHARVYNYDGSSWNQLGQDIDGESAGDHFGVSVSISSDANILAIGGSTNNGSFGHVRVFEWNGISWIQIGEDIDGDASGDYSGYRTSINNNGNILAIGSPFSNGGTGKVKVFEWYGNNWLQIGQDILPDTVASIFGRELSLNGNGNILSIGAAAFSAGSNSSGYVRLYQWNGMNWIKYADDINGIALDDDQGIVSLNNAGNTVVIGAPQIFNSQANGYVRVFDVTPNPSPPCSGCTDNAAVNYDSLANDDDGSCISQEEYILDSLNNVIDDATTSLSSLQQALDTWNTTIDLSSGWNMFGYGCPSPIDIAEGLSNHTDIISIVKDNNGNVYMPEFSFNGIGDLTPGFGYQIKVTEAIEGFSLCDWYVNDIPEDNIVSLQEGNLTLINEVDQLNEELLSLNTLIDSINAIGCTDSLACNYTIENLFDDGSCEYPDLIDCNGNEITPYVGMPLFGGIVFYIDESGNHGLITTQNNLGGYSWGCMGDIIFDIAPSNELGGGFGNTLQIINNCDEITAASVCSDYENNNAWWLPNKTELDLLLSNSYAIGSSSFPNGRYWSSNELFSSSQQANVAEHINFPSLTLSNEWKTSTCFVRPIRSF
jgi:hypothetical protein